jgi:outer membrane immunogenic protein
LAATPVQNLRGVSGSPWANAAQTKRLSAVAVSVPPLSSGKKSRVESGDMVMKQVLWGAISALALGAVGPSLAADMPVKAPILKAAPYDPYDPWTGFYVGGNIGYSWAGWSSSNPVPANNLAAGGLGNFGPGLVSTANPNVDGVIGGLQAGYNWHVDRNWVFGLEGDFQWSGERATNNGSAVLLNVPFADGRLIISDSTANTWKLSWLSTIRARGGWLFDPQWLLYGTVGVAFGRASYAITNTLTATRTFTGGVSASVSSFNSEARTEAGWTLGAGIEHQLARHWSAKLEYLYVDLGTHRFVGLTGFDTDVKLRDNIMRVGLNYQFH